MGEKERKGHETESKLTRIGAKFEEELKQIQEERIKSGVDKNRTSIKKLTNLIITHEHWGDIRRDTLAIQKIR